MAWEGKLWTEGPVHYYLLGPGGQPSLTPLFAHLARYHGEQAAEDQCGEHRGESPGFSRDSLLFRCFHQPEHWGSDPLPRDSLSKRQQWKAISSSHQRKRHCGGNKGEYLYMSGWQHSTNAISSENYNIWGCILSCQILFFSFIMLGFKITRESLPLCFCITNQGHICFWCRTFSSTNSHLLTIYSN